MARALCARAPAASLIAASRSALCARRSAPRALRACVPGQGSRWLRGCAIAASRYALGADGVGAARPGACGSLIGASRYALGADGVAAARPGAYCASPRSCARCLLVVGMSKTSCAARCSRRSLQGLFRAPAKVKGGSEW